MRKFVIHQSPMSNNVESLLRLSKQKRMEVAETLWLSVADETSLSTPAAHKKIIDQRLANYRSGVSVPIPHSEMMKRLRSK